MEHRKWDSKTKFQIVLEGLKTDANVTEVCNRHQISQTQYYKWRDQFLANGPKTFEREGKDHEKERLKEQVRKLKTIVGELTVELKKNDFDD